MLLYSSRFVLMDFSLQYRPSDFNRIKKDLLAHPQKVNNSNHKKINTNKDLTRNNAFKKIESYLLGRVKSNSCFLCEHLKSVKHIVLNFCSCCVRDSEESLTSPSSAYMSLQMLTTGLSMRVRTSSCPPLAPGYGWLWHCWDLNSLSVNPVHRKHFSVTPLGSPLKCFCNVGHNRNITGVVFLSRTSIMTYIFKKRIYFLRPLTWFLRFCLGRSLSCD